MKKKICHIAVLAFTISLLGGCGTPMYEMTEDEENLVVQYAAYALAKHNIYQKDGMTNATAADTEGETEIPEETENSEVEVDDNEQPNGNSGKGETAEQSEQAVSIAKAAGLENTLEVTLLGSRVADVYQEGKYFSVNASDNKKLVIMEFKLKNTGKKALKLDMTKTGCSFSGSFDGENRIPEKKTFGEKILSSFSGKIKAKAAKKAYLIFEVSEEAAKSYQSGKLYVTVNGQTCPVKL